ncbi:hypothetical protein BDW67DRAFT_187654 [Aspergillus spinulosporus]
MLCQIYDTLIPQLVHDLKIQAGLEVMHRITADIIAKLEPIVHRYHESRNCGRSVCERLRRVQFPMEDDKENSYETLIPIARDVPDVCRRALNGIIACEPGALGQGVCGCRCICNTEYPEAESVGYHAYQGEESATLLVPQRPPMAVDADQDEEAVDDVLVREFYY